MKLSPRHYDYFANEDLALSAILALVVLSWWPIIRYVLVPLSVAVLGEW